MRGIELKPCPFCGGEAGIMATIKKNVDFAVWCQCKKCGARAIKSCPYINNEETVMSSIERSTKRAVAAWNQRAGDTP